MQGQILTPTGAFIVKGVFGTIAATLVCAVTISTLSAVRGHATEEDLQRVELESKTRDGELKKTIDEVRDIVTDERLEQAKFRAKVLERLKIDAEPTR